MTTLPEKQLYFAFNRLHTAEYLRGFLQVHSWVFLFVLGAFFVLFCLLSRATPVAYGHSQARGQIGATPAGLRHSQSNVGFKPGLRPTPQLTAMLDP